MRSKYYYFYGATTFALVLANPPAFGHGESIGGVGGAGVNTVGAVIAERPTVGLRYQSRSYDQFSDAQLLAFQAQGQDVHQHSGEHTAFLGGSFPLGRDTDLTLQLPLVRFVGFKDNSNDYALTNQTISTTDVSQGVGDLLALLRQRIWQHDEQHVALIAGIKAPTGATNRLTNEGEPVGTHNQPGSGSWDAQAGVAYSGHWRDILAISADFLLRYNTTGARTFRSGNSVQTDLAILYMPHRDFSPVVEFNAILQERDTENGGTKLNSGVRSLFLAPGFRWRITPTTTVFGAVAVPLIQELPGIQNDERFRVTLGLGTSF